MGTFVSDYLEKVLKLRESYTEYLQLVRRKLAVEQDYLQCREALQSVEIVHPFPVFEQELAQRIATFEKPLAPKEILSELRPSITSLQKIDVQIDVLKELYAKYEHAPDRYGARALVVKLKRFLDKLPTLPLARVEEVENQTIPKIIAAFEHLEHDFQKEQEWVKKIQSDCELLDLQLKKYEKAVDRNGMAKVRKEAKQFIERFLKAPNFEDLASDEQLLAQHTKKLKQVLNAFAADLKALSGFHVNRCLVWKEASLEIEKIQNEAEQNPFTATITLATLEEMQRRKAKEKTDDIENYLKKFRRATLKKFKSDIEQIAGGFMKDLHDLEVLAEKMRAYEKKVKLKITIGLIIGGLVGADLFVIILSKL